MPFLPSERKLPSKRGLSRRPKHGPACPCVAVQTVPLNQSCPPLRTKPKFQRLPLVTLENLKAPSVMSTKGNGDRSLDNGLPLRRPEHRTEKSEGLNSARCESQRLPRKVFGRSRDTRRGVNQNGPSGSQSSSPRSRAQSQDTMGDAQGQGRQIPGPWSSSPPSAILKSPEN